MQDDYEGQPTGLLSPPGRYKFYVNKRWKGGEPRKTLR